MGDYGFRVSKTGYDVKTAALSQLALTSANLSDTVFVEGYFTYSHSGTSSSFTVHHNLGYVPRFYAYNVTEGRLIPHISGNSTGAFTAYSCYATSTTLVIATATNAATTFSANFVVKILNSPIQ